MRRCSWCGHTGHNRRTCSRRTESLTRSAEAGNHYAKVELERRVSRTCSFCSLSGHDRRTCQELQDSVAKMGRINLDVRSAIHKRAKEHNFGVGSLVSVEVTNWADGDYQKSEAFGIVQRITWDNVNYTNEWDQSSSYPSEPVVVQFFTGSTERRFRFPFEIGYLGRKERSEFSSWRFNEDLKIVNGVRADNEGNPSLSDREVCQKLAKRLFKEMEWKSTTASRKIDYLADTFTY